MIGNVLWFVLAGLWMALADLIAGVIRCVTIIGIPFGIQSFKLAGYALWPFGRVVVQRTDRDEAHLSSVIGRTGRSRSSSSPSVRHRR